MKREPKINFVLTDLSLLDILVINIKYIYLLKIKLKDFILNLNSFYLSKLVVKISYYLNYSSQL